MNARREVQKNRGRLLVPWLVCLLCLCRVPSSSAEATTPPDTCSADSVCFVPLHVYVDPDGRPLAAYQVELSDSSGSCVIVGIEGGEHPAFRKPPYHDPAALHAKRIVLAAYSTASDLPRTRSRIATVHLMTRAAMPPTFETVLQVAATIDGSRINARASSELGEAR